MSAGAAVMENAPSRSIDASIQRQFIVTLSFVYMLLATCLSVTASMPEVRRVIPMSDVVTSLHGSFFGWGLIVSGLVGWLVMARVQRKHLLLGGVVAMAVGAVAFAGATEIWQTLLGTALSGIGGAIVVTVIPAVVNDAYGDRRSEVFTLVNVAPALAGLLFPLSLTGAATLGWSWRLPTAVLPVAMLLGVAVVTRPIVGSGVTRPLVPALSGSVFAVVAPLRGRRLRQRFMLQLTAVSLEFGFGAWIVTYLREDGGFSRSLAPLGSAAWAVGMLASRALVPKLLRWFGDRLELACFIAMSAGALLVLWSPVPALRLAFVVLVSFGIGPVYTLGVERLFVISDGPDSTSAVSSLAALASGLGITIGPLLVGAISDRLGLRAGLTVVPIVAVIGALAALLHWGNEAGWLGTTRTPS